MFEDKKILCVVTARAGSKGILGKNYKDLLGKPLFMWSVLAGLKSQYVDEVVLSSNCPECLTIFEDYAIKRDEEIKIGDKYLFPSLSLIKRPEKYSTDTSKNEEALVHALKIVGKSNFDIVINLQPTSPCRSGNLLDKCIEMYYNEGADSLLTGTKITPFLWRKQERKWIYNVDKNDCCNRKMRQQFSEDENNSEFIFHDNGNIYIMDTKMLLSKECRIGYNPIIYETEGLCNLQIDTLYDFDLIEKMLSAKNITSLV